MTALELHHDEPDERPANLSEAGTQEGDGEAETGKSRGPGIYTPSHKENVRQGLVESHAVGRYLEVVSRNRARPGGGNRRTEKSIRKSLARIEEKFGSASAVVRLQLVQQKMDLEQDLAIMTSDEYQSEEDNFITHAAAYAERMGISYEAFRTMGVASDMLTKAGIKRS